MKFLTVPRLQKLSAMMQAVDVGDRIIHARVEAYSCKLAGSDKRTAKEITGAIDASLSHHGSGGYHQTVQTSPLGDLHEPATKHLLVSLITTLNASFPDYDFSNLRPDEFQREQAPQIAMNSINSLFLNAVGNALSSSGFRTEFWAALEETVFLHECEIYKYEPNEESDLNLGKLWTVNYFFFNRKLKKMLLLTAEAISKLHLQNTHSVAYQQHMSRRSHPHHTTSGMEDDMEGESDDDDFVENDAQNTTMRNENMDEDDDDPAAMLDEEQQMLDDMQAESNGGSTVDVSLLEWDGLPLDQLDQQRQLIHQQQQQQLDLNPPPLAYDSSPSHSSASSIATIQFRPTPHSHPNSALQSPTATPASQVRLASTKSPTIGGRRSPNMKPGHLALTPLPPAATSTLTIGGGSLSNFQSLTPPSIATSNHLPAVPLFAQTQEQQPQQQ